MRPSVPQHHRLILGLCFICCASNVRGAMFPFFPADVRHALNTVHALLRSDALVRNNAIRARTMDQAHCVAPHDLPRW